VGKIAAHWLKASQVSLEIIYNFKNELKFLFNKILTKLFVVIKSKVSKTLSNIVLSDKVFPSWTADLVG